MRTDSWIVAAGLLAALWAGGAAAQNDGVPRAPVPETRYINFAPTDANAPPSPSPSDNKPAADANAGKPGETPQEGKKEEGKADEGKKDEEKKDEVAPEEEKPRKLIDGPCLEAYRIDIHGWIDQGFIWNPQSPANHLNGPVGYDDFSNDYMLNQLYLVTERVTKTDGCGTDIGGRVDLLYGTDWRYVRVNPGTGFDSDWGGPFYGLSMPQLYGDFAVNDTIFRVGHFLAPVGYENVQAPLNFFYSHSYTFLYGQPTTLTGGQIIHKCNDQWSFNVGIDTGWNNWDSPNNQVGFFGGVNWTSQDSKTTILWEGLIGDQVGLTPATNGLPSVRPFYDIVLTHKIDDKWNWAVEHELGDDSNVNGPCSDALWASVVGYLFYNHNDCWTWGGRYEWFSDADAAVVTQIGPPAAGPFRSSYSDFTFGFNHKPNKNITWRSEIRWDFADTDRGPRPFADNTRDSQFLWANDLIIQF